MSRAPNITFISASAGSGKTHRITGIIEERLARGECRPGGLIATTFTVRAAQELRERVAQRLHRSGHSNLAERLRESLMGTVHGVCGQLLERFAFEGGISPRVEILAEEDASALLGEAIEHAVDGRTLMHLQRLAERLGQKCARTHRYHWKRQVRDLINASRENDIPAGDLPLMAERSVDELLRFLPDATSENLDDQLAVSMARSLDRISQNGDDTKTTAAYLELLRERLRALRTERLAWSDWIQLGKQRPAVRSRTEAESIAEVVSRVEQHPRLRDDIREYITLVYAVARLSLEEFSRLKETRGLLDFCDLEHRAYLLVRARPEVLDGVDLLVVDEFQDTSPLQLALFMQLAAGARETVWVGDVKQAIYGFRNSDPELMNCVLERIRNAGKLAEPLSMSWRSTPELVQLTNALFVPAFAESLNLPTGEVQLEAMRNGTIPEQTPLEFFELSSGRFNKTDGRLKKLTWNERAVTLAEGVRKLMERRPSVLVQEKGTDLTRPIEARDVAVLCRTNKAAGEVATKLAERGLPVTLSQAGLMETPEVRLALACLRRLADPMDSLAAAEIVALSGDTKEWLTQRLRYVAGARDSTDSSGNDRWGVEGDFLHPALCALESARTRLNIYSPREALDVALLEGKVAATASAWGMTLTKAVQRRANLEALRGIAVKFEQASAKSHSSATIAGFLAWCDSLAEAGIDFKAVDERAHAVTVSTYHLIRSVKQRCGRRTVKICDCFTLG